MTIHFEWVLVLVAILLGLVVGYQYGAGDFCSPIVLDSAACSEQRLIETMENVINAIFRK